MEYHKKHLIFLFIIGLTAALTVGCGVQKASTTSDSVEFIGSLTTGSAGTLQKAAASQNTETFCEGSMDDERCVSPSNIGIGIISATLISDADSQYPAGDYTLIADRHMDQVSTVTLEEGVESLLREIPGLPSSGQYSHLLLKAAYYQVSITNESDMDGTLRVYTRSVDSFKAGDMVLVDTEDAAGALPTSFYWVMPDGLVRDTGYRPEGVVSMATEESSAAFLDNILLDIPLGLYIPDGYAVVVVHIEPVDGADPGESQSDTDQSLRLSIHATFNTENMLRYMDINRDGELNLSGISNFFETQGMKLFLPVIELSSIWS